MIFVGDAAMAPSELYQVGGAISYGHYNQEAGITWMLRVKNRFDRLAWFNPIPKDHWPYDYGAQTIKVIGQMIPMYHLSAEELAKGLKHLITAR